METKAKKQRADLSLADEPVTMTQSLIGQFLSTVKASGRQPQTVQGYRRSLEELYDFLPEDKEITRENLEDWRKSLKQSGYAVRTINMKLIAVNGLLRYCGAESLLVKHEKLVSDDVVPEMTREEYLEFLTKVRESGSEKYFFLIKVFASVDICIGELDHLTVEACREGVIHKSDRKTVLIPACLREELLQYAERHKILSGPIFRTRDGKPMNRSGITAAIQKLAAQAGMEPEKCSPSGLHRLYLTTKSELWEQLQPLLDQSYESLLKVEQTQVAWK